MAPFLSVYEGFLRHIFVAVRVSCHREPAERSVKDHMVRKAPRRNLNGDCGDALLMRPLRC